LINRKASLQVTWVKVQ